MSSLRFSRFLSTNLTKRSLSNIVRSPYSCPELRTDLINLSVPQFTMAKFLNEDVQNKTAFVDGSTGESWTYKQMFIQTHKFSHCLLDLGISKGDCVGIMSPNHIHFFTGFQGLGLIGAISTPINPLYTETEIEYQLNSTQAKLVMAHPFCLDKVKNVAKKLKIRVITFGSSEKDIPSVDDLISGQSQTAPVNIQVDPTSTATIPFSSGTTGLSKGVVLSHRNLVSNVLQLYAPETKYFHSGTTLLVPLPFFHIYGLVLGLLTSARHNAKTVFMPAFDLPKFLELAQSHKVTRTYIVPPIILALAKHPLVDSYDLSSLKVIISGAAPLGGDVQEACAKRLNCIVKQAWGMTELSPGGAITPDELVISHDSCKGTSGQLVSDTEALIIDPMTGSELHPTQEGELLLRGPQVMQGYLNNKDATEKTIRPDGFMHTGDIAKFDEKGFLYITDRCKELIKYKGFQVAPAELEGIINSMPVVKDVVVIPVPCDEAGEIPRAYVTLQPGHSHITESHIIDYVHERVAPHKKLRGGIIFSDNIPRSASGKLLRRVQIEMDRAAKK